MRCRVQGEARGQSSGKAEDRKGRGQETQSQEKGRDRKESGGKSDSADGWVKRC
jgi:hypothetical protein